MKYLFKILLLLLVFISSCKTVHYCKSGEPVVIRKKVSKNYPPYVKTFEGSLKSNINVIDEIDITELDLQTKNSVTNLREKLNQLSTNWENILKSAFLAYSTTPCDKDVRKKYFDLLESIKQEVSKLEELKITTERFTNRNDFGDKDAIKLKNGIQEYLSKTNSNNILDKN